MTLPGITHEFGPWSPMRFIPIPFRPDGEAPAFWIATSRMCRGVHDWRCTQAETQTFGPLVLEGVTEAQLYTCANCGRVQPPVDTPASGEQPVCLFCSDMATVQRPGAGPDTREALAAVAALHAATGTLRNAKEADPAGYLALLDETGDSLRAIMEDAAWAVKQDQARAQHTGYRNLVLVARQVLANAKDYAALNSEPLPVKETDTE